MIATTGQQPTAVDLLRDYEGLAGHLLKLTKEHEHSVVADLDDALSTGDPKTLDAALRAVIRTAQAARKSIKAGPPATATPNGIQVDDDVEIPWGIDGDWRRGTVTALSRDGSEVLVKRGSVSGWETADEVRKA